MSNCLSIFIEDFKQLISDEPVADKDFSHPLFLGKL